MYNDIQILVQGFYWNQNVINENYKDVSFFNWGVSGGTRAYTDWTSQLDITPYIIKDSLSPLTMEFENSEKTTDSSRMYFTCSDISFQVSDLPNLISATVNGVTVTRMRDFFSMVEKAGIGTGDTSYIKYLVIFKYQGNVVFQGVVSDDVKETFSTQSDSNVIDIQVFGFEKDIKEYYSNKKLSDYSYNYGTMTYGYLNLTPPIEEPI